MLDQNAEFNYGWTAEDKREQDLQHIADMAKGGDLKAIETLSAIRMLLNEYEK